MIEIQDHNSRKGREMEYIVCGILWVLVIIGVAAVVWGLVCGFKRLCQGQVRPEQPSQPEPPASPEGALQAAEDERLRVATERLRRANSRLATAEIRFDAARTERDARVTEQKAQELEADSES